MQEQTSQLEHQSKVKVGAFDVIVWSTDTVCSQEVATKPIMSENITQTPQQEYEAALEQLKGEQIHLQGEERRKTLGEETKQNHAVWNQHCPHHAILTKDSPKVIYTEFYMWM